MEMTTNDPWLSVAVHETRFGRIATVIRSVILQDDNPRLAPVGELLRDAVPLSEAEEIENNGMMFGRATVRSWLLDES